MKKIQKITASAVTAAMAITLAACASGGGSDPAEIALWIPDDGGSVASYVEDYNSSQDEYTVTVRAIPFDAYDDALNQAFSAGQGPDLAQINGSSFAPFADRGFLQQILPISGEEGSLDPGNFYPQLYDVGNYKGEQLALPIDTGTRVLQWNAALFEKAGVEPFEDVVGWDEMLAAAQAIRALGDEYQGYCYVGGERNFVTYAGVGSYIRQAGGTFINDDLTEATLDTPEVKKAVEFFAELARTGNDSNVISTSPTSCQEGFGAGTVGMQYTGFWDEPEEEQVTADFDLRKSLPMDRTVYSTTGGWLLAVPAYVDEAKFPAIKAFLEDMYKTENLARFTGLFPATLDGRESTALTGDRYDLYWEVLAENADHPIPLNPALAEQSLLIVELMQKVIQGTTSTDDALAQAQADFQATLGD